MESKQIEAVVLEHHALQSELRRQSFFSRYIKRLESLTDLDSKIGTKEDGLDELVEKYEKLLTLRAKLREIVANDSVIQLENPKAKFYLDEFLKGSPNDTDLDDFLSDEISWLEEAEPSFREYHIKKLALLSAFGEERIKTYFRRLMEISLVTRGDISTQLHAFISEARQAYAHNLPNSVYALCRTCLERNAIEVGQHIDYVPKDFYIPERNKYYCTNRKEKHKYRIRRIFQEVTKGETDLCDDAYDLYLEFNRTIHGSEVAEGILKDKICDTIRVTGRIRGRNKVRN